MASKQTTPFDELARLADEFVTAQNCFWDHAAWLDFLARVQRSGIEMSTDMGANLGELLEAMKAYKTTLSSTEAVEQATNTVLKNSIDFVKRHQGVWGHADWEDFLQTTQENAHAWSEGMETYLGNILEALKPFYVLYPAVTVEESTSGGRNVPAARREATASPPSADTPDDLTAIVGLGPATAKKLQQEGIVSYAQLAALSNEEIARIERDVIKSLGRFTKDDWVGQARRLARV
jgi:predicted flap endonuclease-1-like 5' DNA nuclease